MLEQSKNMESEMKEQKFDADFIMIEAVFSALVKKLLDLFKVPASEARIGINKKAVAV